MSCFHILLENEIEFSFLWEIKIPRKIKKSKCFFMMDREKTHHVNRNTVKISYRCVPNMGSYLAKHNAKILKNDQGGHKPLQPKCNYQKSRAFHNVYICLETEGKGSQPNCSVSNPEKEFEQL